jgi:hypothetical protein
MGQVNVIFHGVCTHFIGVVPGVPQRVVLPDASALRLGFLHVPDAGTGSYALMPHFPILRLIDTAVRDQITIASAIDRGNITNSVRLEIANAIGPPPEPDLAGQGLPSLRSFVHDYVYSQDVVTGGRAAAYFDVHHAASETVAIFPNGAMEVVVAIETDGPPVLRATPFFGGTAHEFPLLAGSDSPESVSLWVANQGMDCHTEENNYDFVLHYLTGRSGIPRDFTQMPFGLETGPLGLVPHQTFDQEADLLKTLDYPASLDTSCFQLQTDPVLGTMLITSAACSNSTYP